MDATKLVVLVLAGLISYYLSDTFLTSIITGTSTADTLLQNILPITIAGAIVLSIVKFAF